jgi:uncharacterized RDD family membrane protein YckC
MKTFSARETPWLQELDGIELASFRQRAFAILIDTVILGIVFSAILSTITTVYVNTHPNSSIAINLGDAAHKLDHLNESDHRSVRERVNDALFHESMKVLQDILAPIVYFGLLLWQGNGRTPGKRLMKIRVVSLVHTHITFWHAVERALGYGAATLELGFGFIQFFIHPYRRCAQDRLAETIVVTERSYQQKFPPTLPPPPETDTLPEPS